MSPPRRCSLFNKMLPSSTTSSTIKWPLAAAYGLLIVLLFCSAVSLIWLTSAIIITTTASSSASSPSTSSVHPVGSNNKSSITNNNINDNDTSQQLPPSHHQRQQTTPMDVTSATAQNVSANIAPVELNGSAHHEQKQLLMTNGHGKHHQQQHLLKNGYIHPHQQQQNKLLQQYEEGKKHEEEADEEEETTKTAEKKRMNGSALLNGHSTTNGYQKNALLNGLAPIASVANGNVVASVGATAAAAMVRHIPRGIARPQRRLRIAQIAPLYESVPPKMYGGTERVVYHLTEELVRRGHEVTLFCSADSQTSAKMVFHESWPALRLNPVPDVCIPYQWLMEQVRLRADDFDILHFHTMEHFTLLHNFQNRSVTTLHGLLSFPDLVTLLKCFNQAPLISISDDQRRHLDYTPNWVGTVYHGIPHQMLPFTAQPRAPGYLAFLGRITDVKRPEWAIQIAVRAGLPLKMAAKVDKVDGYWEAEVKPLVEKHSDLVEFIGEINDSEKGEFLGNAMALLFPIDWNEPFGLVMIEAMACGTPVVARSCGSVPEIVEDGVNGLIFDTIEEGVAAVKRVSQMDRAEVRRSFERRFTAEKMAENYLKIYEKMLTQAEEEKTNDHSN